MFGGLAWLTTRLWPLVIAAWAVAAGVLIALAPPWEDVAREGNNDYLPEGMTSVRGQDLLRRVFPGENPQLTLVDVPDTTALAKRLLALAQGEAGDQPERIARWILEALGDEPTRALAAGVAEGELLETEEDALLTAINQVLRTPELVLEEDVGNGDEPIISYQRMLAARRALEQAFPERIVPLPEGEANTRIVFLVERPEAMLTSEDLAAADALAARFEPHPDEPLPIVSQLTHTSPLIGNQLISDRHADGGQAVLVIVGVRNELLDTINVDLLEEVQRRMSAAIAAEDWPAGLNVWLTGSAAIGGDLVQASAESIARTEMATVLLVLGILLFVYRAPLLVFVPLATIATSVVVSLTAITLLASVAPLTVHILGWSWDLHFEVFSTSRIFIIVILFGAGTDFCLFLIARYREELAQIPDRREALGEAQRQVGPAIVASALTTVLGLSTLYFADFGKYSFAGPTVGACLLVALLACLTLAPALLQCAGRAVFWPFSTRIAPEASTEGKLELAFWRRLANFVIHHPRAVLVVSLLILIPWAWAGRNVPTSFDFLKELPADRVSVRGTERLAQYFPAGDIGPVTIVVYRPDGELDSRAGRREIAVLTQWLYHYPEGAEDDPSQPRIINVRSLAEPVGGRPGRLTDTSRLLALRAPRTLDYYLSPVAEYRGRYTRMEVIFNRDPFSHDSMALLQRLDHDLQALSAADEGFWSGAEFDFTGMTSTLRDLEAVTTGSLNWPEMTDAASFLEGCLYAVTGSDLLKARPLVVIVVFAVLVLLIRNLLVCLYLILTVLLTYFVTMQVTYLVFSLIYGPQFDGLDWRVPMFLFVILVAVGVDYNIYLITRVNEEQAELGLLPGLREAATRTGGIITSCGLIMAGTFFSMTFGSLRGIAELGFALAFGILLDTFVVRTLLVPAFLAWLYGAPAALETAPAESPAEATSAT